ncbi:MAG: lytic transglycosylase F, partial [Thermoanaerobaculia bacterium]
MSKTRRYLCGFGTIALFALAACSGPPGDDATAQSTLPAASAEPADNDGEELVAALGDPDLHLPEGSKGAFDPWTGDFDAMVERRMVRALVVPNRISYFLDGPNQQGVAYELLTQFEDLLNESLESGHLKVYVVIIPTSRDRLFPALLAGYGDLAVANLTVTAEREAEVDFADPLLTGVDEIVVTGPGAPPLASLDDLAGQEVYVRKTSSYYESLRGLNERLRQAGKPEVTIREASELLETEDILEMVNAGLVPITVADTYLAEFWAQVFDGLTLHPELTVRTGGQIAWAMRKESPQLTQVMNAFVKDHKKGTLMGNILFKRYLQNSDWVRDVGTDEEMARYRDVVQFFQDYAPQYDFDFLMMTAQGYQESRLDQSVRSPVGAIGVMQLLPSTAADPNVGIPEIEVIHNNVHAGIKYMRFIVDHYFDDPEIDNINRTLMAFASYNAGPNRIARLRKKAEEAGLDPNIWFQNVEVIAAHDIGRETVQY